MSFTIYFALVALMNIFLGYFLAMRLGFAVPGVSRPADPGVTDEDWDTAERSDDSDES